MWNNLKMDHYFITTMILHTSHKDLTDSPASLGIKFGIIAGNLLKRTLLSDPLREVQSYSLDFWSLVFHTYMYNDVNDMYIINGTMFMYIE